MAHEDEHWIDVEARQAGPHGAVVCWVDDRGCFRAVRATRMRESLALIETEELESEPPPASVPVFEARCDA